MRICAFDPGGTTGVAMYDQDRKSWERYQLGPYEHHQKLESLLYSYSADVVIYERFMYQRRELDKGVSLRLDSVEYIGIIKLWAAKHPNTSVHCQTPAQAKNLWTDDKLKKVELWIPGNPHAMDATRHLLYYLVVNQGEKSWIQKLRPSRSSLQQTRQE
jgi:hypothetical protein